MNNVTPIDAFLSVVEYLEQNRDWLPDEFGEFLLPAMRATMTGTAKSMDHGLGIAVGPGEARQRLCYVWRTRERNRLIRAAACNLTPDYSKKLTAKLIAHAMNQGIPPIHSRNKSETVLLLGKLRTICMDHRGDSPLAIGWKRTQEIMNGDGC